VVVIKRLEMGKVARTFFVMMMLVALSATASARSINIIVVDSISVPKATLQPAAEHDTTIFFPAFGTRGVVDTTKLGTDGIKSYGRSPGHSQVDWTKFGIASGSLILAIGALHVYQLNAWWANQRTTFHVIDDVDYKANFDKAGHTFGAYYSSHFFGEAFNWSGFDSAQSDALAATCGLLWELYVEIEDGYARDWGFSRGDAISDFSGAGFYLLRNRIPYLRNLEYKWTYFPSQQLLENKPDIPGQSLNFIEDYGGQSYWLSMNIHGMLPEAAKPYWPEWLNLAVGVAGWNLDARTPDGYNDFSKRKKAWLIALDYDIGRLIPESDIGIINFIRRGLDYWHFPAPAYRIYPEPRFYILFPFRMSIG
jgi:hypothetical protein